MLLFDVVNWVVLASFGLLATFLLVVLGIVLWQHLSRPKDILKIFEERGKNMTTKKR